MRRTQGQEGGAEKERVALFGHTYVYTTVVSTVVVGVAATAEGAGVAVGQYGKQEVHARLLYGIRASAFASRTLLLMRLPCTGLVSSTKYSSSANTYTTHCCWRYTCRLFEVLAVLSLWCCYGTRREWSKEYIQ